MRTTCRHGVNQLVCTNAECVEAVWGSPTDPTKLNADFGDDVITGYPDHYILNGDPTSCGCPEHIHLHEAAMAALTDKGTKSSDI